jgi:hypothetical protein
MNTQLSLFHEPTERAKLRNIRRNAETGSRKQELEGLRTTACYLIHRNESFIKIYFEKEISNCIIEKIYIPYVCCTDMIREHNDIKTRPKWDMSNNIMGHVFRGSQFVWVGMYESKVYNSHGNEINLYTLPEYAEIVKRAISMMGIINRRD